MSNREASNRRIAQELAKAAAEWLADKAESWRMERGPLDEETLMSEALLMIPVVDYLLREKWNRLIGEWSLDASGQDVPKGAVNFDLYAENASDMALIEWKYIKKNSNQRLIVDFVKLALPGRAFNVRFLLAANRKKSKLLKDIADKKKTTFIVSTWPELKITSDLCAAGHSITGEDKKRIGKLLQLDASLKCFSVEPIAEVENVSIFSISRSWDEITQGVNTAASAR